MPTTGTATATITLLAVMAYAIIVPSQGLSGPALYVYPENAVYPPSSTATFRVLAVDAEENPAAGIVFIASLYGPEGGLLSSYEGETGPDGWHTFQLGLDGEGIYRIVVEDPTLSFSRAEASILACASCPSDSQRATITTTQTTTFISTETTTATIYTTTTAAATTLVTTQPTTKTEKIAATAITTTITIHETQYSTHIISLRETITITAPYPSMTVNTVTVELTKTVPSSFEPSYLFYMGLSMVIIFAVSSAIVARHMRATSYRTV